MQRLGSPLTKPDQGPLFEQWIINQVYAYQSYFHVELTSNPGIKHLSGLKSILQEYPNLNAFLVCDVLVQDEIKVQDKKVLILPYAQFLENIGIYAFNLK